MYEGPCSVHFAVFTLAWCYSLLLTILLHVLHKCSALMPSDASLLPLQPLQAMMFAALNGVGLALLVPCCQSLIADLYPAEQRGRAFGTLQLTASLGGMLGGVFATNMGGHRVAGMDGWRVAFHTIAALSLIVGKCRLLDRSMPNRMFLWAGIVAVQLQVVTCLSALWLVW